MADPSAPQPLVPPGLTWSHSPRPDRDDSTTYRLPQSEVLPWLSEQTDFLAASSSPSNDEARRVIYEEQYPHLHGEIGPLAERPSWSAPRTALEIESFVRGYADEHLGGRFVKVGYTPVLPSHVYLKCDQRLSQAIVLGLPMRYHQTNLAPEPAAGEEVTCNYKELGGLALALGRWVREQGFSAEVHHPRGDSEMNCEILFVPHAVAAGFGELGRHGSLISREFGPRIRLSMITTDALLPEVGESSAGVAEFCTWCTKCLAACPVDAIPQDRTTQRGSYRFVVDTSACLPYFAQTDGCGICIAVCPYNRETEEGSSEFTDQVLAVDWVQEARRIAATDGIKAMERAVHKRKAGGTGERSLRSD